MGNGLISLTCEKETDDLRLAVAQYNDLGGKNFNLNQQPDDFIKTAFQSDANLVPGKVQTFTPVDTGVSVSVGIVKDTVVGTATNSDGQQWTVSKDTNRFVFTNSDNLPVFCCIVF